MEGKRRQKGELSIMTKKRVELTSKSGWKGSFQKKG